MRKNISQITARPNAAPALQAALWIVAIGVPSFILYNKGVQAARIEAEQRVLTQVAQTVQSSSTDLRELLALLSQHEKEVSSARYYRTCTRLGLKPDWKPNWINLFTEVSRRGKEDQAKAALVIAEECNLSPDTNLKRERIFLTLQLAGPAEAQVLPTVQTPAILPD